MTTGTSVPCTPVDELSCYFDDPVEPNDIHLEAHLSGHVDPVRLRSAVLAALNAHPLARARLRPARGWDRRLRWDIPDAPDVSPVDTVHWRDPAELAAHRQRLMDAAPPLATSPPLRVRHAVGPEWDALILNAHHAVLDGLSCLWLLRSVARHYTGRPDPVPDPLGTRLPPGVPARGTARAMTPAVRVAPDGGAPSPGCGFHLLSLPFHSVRSGPGATVNDLIVAALVLAVDSWNTAHGVPVGTVRVTLPVNARASGDESLGNLSRLTAISADPARRHAVLADVVAQTSAVKRVAGAQVDPLLAVLASPWLPVAVKRRLTTLARRLAGGDTTLLSNLGLVTEPPDFGAGAAVTALWTSAPVRMPRGLSVGAITVRDRLHLCFRYRRALFDDAAAALFAESCRAALESLGDPRVGAPSLGSGP